MERRIISRKAGTRRHIIFPTMHQIFTVEEMHEYGLNLKDFSIYLTGFRKEYGGQDEDFSEPGVEYQMATQFIKNLHVLQGKNARRPILIHMKTCGGWWKEGMAIYDAIRACPNNITILSYTHARSMSSIILQAADKRVLMPNSYFLFHEGTLEVAGTVKQAFSATRWEEKVILPTMLNIYAGSLRRKGKFQRWSLERIRKMLQALMNKREDVYLTAQQAVEWGFADEVFGAGGKFDWESLRKHR